MRRAEQSLAEARQELRDRRAAIQASRVAFGKALEAWNLGAPVMNRDSRRELYCRVECSPRRPGCRRTRGVSLHPGVTRTAKAPWLVVTGRLAAERSYRRGAFTKRERSLTGEV